PHRRRCSARRRPRAPAPLFPYTTLFRSRDAVDGPESPLALSAPVLLDGWWYIDRFDPAGTATLSRVRDRAGLCGPAGIPEIVPRSEEHTSELQSRFDLVCRLLLEIKNSF